MEEKIVYSSTNNMEVDYICSILKENNIAFIKKTEGAGDYLTIAAGNLFNYTTMVLVDEKDYEKAKELLASINDSNVDSQVIDVPDELKNISEQEEKDMEEKAEKTKSHLKLFILLFVFCPILIAVIVAVISSMI